MDESKKYLEEEREKLEEKLAEARALVDQLGEVARIEAENLEQQLENIKQAIDGMEVGSGKDEEIAIDHFKTVMLEVRPGVGGGEAKIWADDLMRMYSRYANIKGWKVSIFDEGVLRISGNGVFEELQYETGVHRVQRVPATEAQGRIHTSTASVVVLPEVPETQIEVKEDELAWEFSRAGGHGGQNVNKVSTAVRLTHKPTGIVVQARQERSQEQNRRIALALLRSQLWEIDQEKKLQAVAGQRAKIGRSMRAEKIRTYNYPQNRVTDHRIGQSWHHLDTIMEGNIDEITQALATSTAGEAQ